jgi:hypothetical protein
MWNFVLILQTAMAGILSVLALTVSSEAKRVCGNTKTLCKHLSIVLC